MAFECEYANTIIRRPKGEFLVLIDRDGYRQAYRRYDWRLAFGIFLESCPFSIEVDAGKLIIYGEGEIYVEQAENVLSLRLSRVISDGSWICEVNDSENGITTYTAETAQDALRWVEEA